MNKKIFCSIVCILTFYHIGYCQFAGTSKISENEFNIEKKADTTGLLAKVANKYKNVWAYVDYETGDAVNCKRSSGTIIKENNNLFEIVNNDVTKTDIWVIFVRILSENSFRAERRCFVKHTESFTIENLKEGNYKLTVLHGNKWKQPLDFSCKGRFMENYNVASFACSDNYVVTKNNSLTFISTNDGPECEKVSKVAIEH